MKNNNILNKELKHFICKMIIHITLLYTILSNSVSSAQQFEDKDKYIPNIFSKNPNVNSLGTYGETDMNLSIGAPDIKFDLFSVSSGSSSLNFSLQYNPSYVKPDNVPSWIGLGWTLNTPNAISRVLNGDVDEYDYNSYYYTYGELAASDWDSDSKMKQYTERAKDMEKSATPDIFTFSVDNIQGQFFKNHEGKWIISSNQQDLKVTDTVKSNDLGMSNFISSFTITDKEGNQYTFGNSPESIEIYTLRKKYVPNADYYYYVKNWYLTSIKYNTNKTVNFAYQKIPGKIYYKNSISYYMRYNFKDWNGGHGCSVGINYHDCYNNLVNFEEGEYSYLYKISFDTGEVIFNRSLANSLEYKNQGYNIFSLKPNDNYYNTKHWYKLDNITINNKNNITVKKVSFVYDESPDRRLKLKSFTIAKDGDNNGKQKFNFEYNNQLFPAFNNNNNDHWGFYNGKSFNTQNIDPANLAENSNYYYASKEPQFKLNEILEKIIYPTGGYSKFVYEPHNYSKMVVYDNGFNISNVNNTTTGGLRIKEIINYDGLLERKKQYFYIDDYFGESNKSTGTISKLPQYYNGGMIASIFSSSSAMPLNTTNGSHVLYSKVFEKIENGAVTEYTFTNNDNGYLDMKANNFSSGVGFIVGATGPNGNGNIVWNGTNYEYYPDNGIYKSYNSLEQERGKLLSKTEYNAVGDKVRSTKYEYNNDNARFNQRVRGLNFEINEHGIFKEVAPPNSVQYTWRYKTNVIKVSAYSHFFYDHYLKSETTTDYFNNKEIITSKKYFYNNPLHNQLTNEETTFSDNTKKSVYYKYAHDFSDYQGLITANMVGIPLMSEEHKIINGVDKIVSKIETEYLHGPGYRDGAFNPVSVTSYNLEDDSSVKVSYNKYDKKGNLLQYTTNNGIPVAIIWGYNQMYPIAKIVGGIYPMPPTGFRPMPPLPNISRDLVVELMDLSDKVLLTPQGVTAEQAKNNFLNALDAFRQNSTLKDLYITTYTYDPIVGVTSITPPSGIRETYLYDVANRLEKVIDINGKVLKEFKYNYKN